MIFGPGFDSRRLHNETSAQAEVSVVLWGVGVGCAARTVLATVPVDARCFVTSKRADRRRATTPASRNSAIWRLDIKPCSRLSCLVKSHELRGLPVLREDEMVA